MLPVKVLVLFFILLQCTHYHWSLKIRPILYPILHNHASFSSQQLSLAKKNIANNGITSTIQQSSIEPNFRNHTLKRFSTMLTHWANLFFPRHDSPTSLQSTNSTACNNDKYSQYPKRNLPFSRSRLSEFVHSSLYTKAGIIRTISFLILIILNSSFLASQFRKKTTVMEVPYSMFLRLLKEKPGSIERLKVSSSGIISFFLQNNPNRCITRQVHISDNLMQQLLQQGVDFSASPPPLKPVPVVFSLVYLGFIWNIAKKILRNFQDDGAGKSKEALNLDRFGDLSFDDFAGQESAKREVQEICHMLHEPEKYLSVGARLPTGVLLVGPPGSGKTLLARVAAREAQVPFFACSATDFVEVFVGRGAARVRKLFKQAAKQVPCILFIDELDSIGRTRRTGGSSSSLGNNAETENTLNALLTMMDGLDTSQSGIIVIAATNRVETLDPALLRAGRFDRIVHCPLPDTNGRKAILETHIRQRGIRLQGVNVNDTVVSDESASELKNESDTEDSSFQESSDSYDFSKDSNWLNDIVRHTKGFSGADLATLVNEAAIRAARRYIDNNSISAQVKYVTESDFDSALRSFLSTRPTLASQNIAYLASNPKFLMESILATDKIANEEKQHLNEHSGKVISSMVDIRRFWSTLFTLAKEKLHIPPTN